MRTFPTIICLTLLIFTSSCGQMLWPWSKLWEDSNKGGSSNSEEGSSPTVPAIEAAKTYAIALGGVAPGRDELVLANATGELIDFTGSSLEFESDTGVVGLPPRPGFEDFASGSGAQIVPQKAGFAVISYYINDVLQGDQFLVIVPPQPLIQMMVSEGSTQITDEADIDTDMHVQLTSHSPTADAIGAVTRNRVNEIAEGADYSLFNVDEDTWLTNPDGSYYDAVITAVSGGVYQYSPVNPLNEAHNTYTNAEARYFLDPSYHRAYDQAVLSAAYIFSEETEDPTGGAFGFFSPTEDEWEQIQLAYDNNMISLPQGCGKSDATFPSLAPIQLVIQEDVWTYATGRPSFIFIRSREPNGYAVVRE